MKKSTWDAIGFLIAFSELISFIFVFATRNVWAFVSLLVICALSVVYVKKRPVWLEV